MVEAEVGWAHEEAGQTGMRSGGRHGATLQGLRRAGISSPFSLSSAGIGIGFYGNSETSDGVSQLSSALLHANHTLSTLDDLVRESATDQAADPCPSWSSRGDVVPAPPPPWRTKAAKQIKADFRPKT